MSPERFKHYMTGIPEIDEQHWELFCILGQIKSSQDSCEDRSVESECRRLVLKFQTCLQKHSEYEHSLLEECGYPFLAHHDEKHLSQFDQYLMKYRRRSDSMSSTLSDSIRDSLMDHIDHADMQYAPILQKVVGTS